MAPWKAPQPVPGTPLRPGNDCDDRARHGGLVLGRATQNYVNQCSDVNNHETPLPAGRTAAFYNPVNCPNPGGHNVANIPAVCVYCDLNSRHQQCVIALSSRMDRPPPAKETKRNGWRFWWTRMCSDCEIREQHLINQVLAGPGPVPPPRPGNFADTVNWPTNTCTCLPLLTEARLCIRHRMQRYLEITGTAVGLAAPAHLNLVATRDTNKDWLKSIALHPASGQTRSAGPNRLSGRNLTKRYRACRCGQEVVTNAAAHFYTCMGCGGHIQHIPLVLPVAPAPHQLWNSISHPHLFDLNRDVHAGVVP